MLNFFKTYIIYILATLLSLVSASFLYFYVKTDFKEDTFKKTITDLNRSVSNQIALNELCKDNAIVDVFSSTWASTTPTYEEYTYEIQDSNSTDYPTINFIWNRMQLNPNRTD